jgi:hypothetical protein
MGLRIVITPADLAWAREAVEKAKWLFPNFCSEGIDTGFPEKGRHPFSDDHLEEVVICRLWLEHFQHAEHVSRTTSSYGCKHHAEDWAGRYVCNAALIAAAAGLGIVQKPANSFGSPNTVLAIKYSSWPQGRRYPSSKPGVESVEVMG